MSELDEAFARTRVGSSSDFTTWVRMTEMPLRRSLRPFAAAVDVEAVLQEGLLRMWTLAPTLELDGENASLHYALRLTRNLALSEVRRLKRVDDTHARALEDAQSPGVVMDDQPDPALARAIERCVSELPHRPRAALMARLRPAPDKALAKMLDMKLNTFLQNVVRARRLLRDCLEEAGVQLREYLT